MSNKYIINFPGRKYALDLCFIGLLLVLVGCNQEYSEDTTSANSDPIPAPTALQRAKLPSEGTLSATLTIDGQPNEMTISGETASFSDSIDAGEHEFRLDIYYESPTVEKLTLVSASKVATVSSNDQVIFGQKEYTYNNEDDDFWTNLREVEAGSNPRVTSSEPSGGDDNYEDNDSIETAYDITSLSGTWLDTRLSTKWGIITFEDQQDLFKFTVDSSGPLRIDYFGQNNILMNLFVTNDNLTLESAGAKVESNEFNEEKKRWEALLTLSNAEARDYFINVFAADGIESGFAGTFGIKWTKL